MSDDVFYLTTPIYYVNDVPHLGHAYTTVVADFIARFRRLQGQKVHFLTGTDEHGLKIARTAEARGLPPKEWTDQIVPRWIELWGALDISNDDFIRTTESRHEQAVQSFMQALHDRGEVYLGTYEGLYCVGCEAFKVPEDLVDGRCPLHGTVPEVVKEDNYFFPLSKYTDRLVELYRRDPPFVVPEARRNEVEGKVKQGLDDLSISRTSFDWGIPIPWDSSHIIYVWVEALQNYITAVGYGSNPEMFASVWPADVHFVGKDILWFHTVIWPAMLMALDLPLPRKVFAHGYLQVGGEKMSKSKLTGISPNDLLPTFGSDAYRYYFVREISFGQDGSFSWESMAARYNSDLANDFGNLASRVLTMAHRYLGGVVPIAPESDELTATELDLRATFASSLRAMEEGVDGLAPHDALRAAWAFVRKANAYVEATTPWALAKSGDSRRLEVVLYTLLDSLRLLALMLWPIIPHAADELWRRLGNTDSIPDTTFGADAHPGLTQSGNATVVGAPLFPRIDEAAAAPR